MLAFVPLGSELERIMGSIRLFYIVVLLATSNAVIHLLIALIVAYNPILSYPELMHQCAIGFSGVLFSMIVIETSLSGIQSRRYALILLVVFQLLMPNVSLLGHLSDTYGFFNIIIPDTSRFSAIESSSWLSTCVRRPKFMMCTGSNVSGHLPTYSSQNTTSSGLLSGNMWRNFSSLLPQRENPPQSMQEDSRFPGAGRTLGSNPNRGSSIGNPDSNLMARLLDDNDSQGHLSAPSLGGQQKPTGRPAAAENTVAAATTRESRHEGHVPSDEDIQKLVAMGFEKVAGNGIKEYLSEPTSNATMWKLGGPEEEERREPFPKGSALSKGTTGGEELSRCDSNEDARPTGKCQGQAAMHNAKAMLVYESAKEFRYAPELY
nr:rhomboid-like protein 15 [Ipomoea trifida]